jgi:hypothetical protein
MNAGRSLQALTVGLTLCVASCGAPTQCSPAVTSTKHETAGSSCGWVYTLSYPGVVDRRMGECSGSLSTQGAPTVSLRKGALLTVRAVPTIGETRIQAPDITTVKQVLAVTQRDNTRGSIEFRAQSVGRGELVAHTAVCNSPRGSVDHCILVHVRVTR